MEVLESQNKEFGFYGTIVDEEILSVETEWASAFQWIAAIMTKWSAEDIRNFLDCHYGHSLANDAMVCEGIMNVPHKWWIKSFFIHAENVGLQEKTPLLEVERFVKLLNMTTSLSASPVRLIPSLTVPVTHSVTANTTNKRHGSFIL